MTNHQVTSFWTGPPFVPVDMHYSPDDFIQSDMSNVYHLTADIFSTFSSSAASAPEAVPVAAVSSPYDLLFLMWLSLLML